MYVFYKTKFEILKFYKWRHTIMYHLFLDDETHLLYQSTKYDKFINL